ncbi:MAG: HPP family protein, partial [Sedimenticola sp.]|nr:HPP family protein [Sedimenticola sp.]
MIEGIVQFARHYLIADIPPLTSLVRAKSALGSLLGLFMAGLLLLAFPAGGLTLIAPMGATAIILFTLSHSPLAQPWPILGGYLVATLSALLATAVTDHFLVAAVLAVGATAWLMLRLRCMHPPGGALALFIVADGTHSLTAALELTEVVIANALALLLAAWALNNLLLGQRYPQCRPETSANLHNTTDRNPTERAGLTHEDLEQAIQGLGTFVDIQERDLVRIYNHAVDNAFERHMAVTCGDVMARDTVSIQFGTELEEAWNLLRKHKIKALPVVDSFQRIIGIVTVA